MGQDAIQEDRGGRTSRSAGLAARVRTALSGTLRALVRKPASHAVRHVWYALPLSPAARERIKRLAFTRLRFALSWTARYRLWTEAQELQRFVAGLEHAPGDTGAPPPAAAQGYVSFRAHAPLPGAPARILCFYLPQFHAIPENDAWWGPGFTEWTNVRPARPQFDGHYQPHVPDALGWYDLLEPGAMARQVALARNYGIGGFCFYFYWFNGRRLLEAPLLRWLEDRRLDLPFCLCWANEPWSRRWDGLDNEVLVAQEHSPADDLAFIEYVSRYMRDERYVRVDGRPLLLVYRPGLLPDPAATSARWRDWCRRNGLPEPYLVCTQSFDVVDPATWGFDAAVEFPPNNSAPPVITDRVVRQPSGFKGIVYDWRIFVERSERYVEPGYTLFRSVCPGWDNTARRRNAGAVFLNNEPGLYRRWLANAVAHTRAVRERPDERLVFVNAWNEWAEGAHLEPDRRDGFAWLEATWQALIAQSEPHLRPDRKLLVVTHDAWLHGAQMLVLHLVRVLATQFGFKVDLVCLGDGPLKAEYARWATLHDLTGRDPEGQEAAALAARLHAQGHGAALCNTAASGLFLGTLVRAGLRCVALIHELPGVIRQFHLERHCQVISRDAAMLVFPAAEVETAFPGIAGVSPGRRRIRPQGLYKRRPPQRSRAADRTALRQRFGLEGGSFVVLGAGYGDARKGIDLFLQAAAACPPSCADGRPTVWLWMGAIAHDMQQAVDDALGADPALRQRVVLAGLQAETDLFFGGADLFVLSSREDPFPSVVLEAMDAGLAVAGFEGVGGTATLVRRAGGRLVPAFDAGALAAAVAALRDDPRQLEAAAAQGQRIVAEEFSFRHYLYDLLDLAGQGLRRISVVIPNYNYAAYIGERLQSVLAQSYPVFEILFLDDASRDDSLAIARGILEGQGVDFRIVPNAANSGSAFVQWRRGVELARGDLVWIAEADDTCGPDLLQENVTGFASPGTVMSYCQSKQIDEAGNVCAEDYLDYVADISHQQWRVPHVRPGQDEIVEALSVKNTIPNVSAVLFDRAVLQGVLDGQFDLVRSFRIAGDWVVYVNVLRSGNIAYSPAAHNCHRRHQAGITLSGADRAHLVEIRTVQDYVAANFPVPPRLRGMAADYMTRLCRQFGISEL